MNKFEQEIKKTIDSLGVCRSYLILGDVNTVSSAMTSTLFAKNVSLLDVIEVRPDGKKNVITVRSIREMAQKASRSPVGENKYVFINEAERLNIISSNALLKILEEPPQRSIFLLLSNNENLIDTIRSRCVTIDFRAEIYNKFDTNKNFDEIDLFFRRSLAENFNQVDNIVKEQKEELFLEKMQEYVYQKMRQKPDKKWQNTLMKVLQKKQEIRQNANKKMALEMLLINIGKYYDEV